MSLIANVNRDKKTKPQPYTAKDFIWQSEKERKHKREMNDQEIFEALWAAFPPEDKDKN